MRGSFGNLKDPGLGPSIGRTKGRCTNPAIGIHPQTRSNFLQIQGNSLEEVASKLPMIDG